MVARIFLPLVSLVLLALFYVGLFHPSPYSVADLKWGHGIGTMTHVEPALRSQGITDGDQILTRSMSLGARYRVRYGTSQNTPIHVVVNHGGQIVEATAPAAQPLNNKNTKGGDDGGWLKWLQCLTVTLSMLLAAYIGARRPSVMMFGLILFLGGGALDFYWLAPGLSALPDDVLGPVLGGILVLSTLFPTLALASFAVRFPHVDIPAEKRLAVRIVDILVLSGLVLEVVRQSGVFVFPQWYQIAYSAIAVGAVLGASIVSLIVAHRHEIGRVAIVFAAVMIGGVGYGVAVLVGNFTGFTPLISAIITGLVVIVPVATMYAILRHRVVDIGFFLNRTIVYVVTSAFVLLLLGAAEFVAERTLSSLTHAESLAVEFAVAMFVVIMARFVHAWIDRVVDRAIFSARYRQVQSLQEFATTAPFYTAQAPLVRDTINEMTQHARVEGAAFYLVEGDVLQPVASTFHAPSMPVEANDKGFVTLRAHRSEVDIAKMNTEILGVRLYPMVLGGRVFGAVSVGERVSHEAMPPDVGDAIARVAAAVTIGLASIENERIRADYAQIKALLPPQRVDVLNA